MCEDKRKANEQELEEQPSPKKEMMVTDGPMVSEDAVEGESGVNVNVVGESETETSSTKGKRRRRDGNRTPAYLKQLWKDDLNSGQLVMSLFELFGEGIMSFIPGPEMSLFL